MCTIIDFIFCGGCPLFTASSTRFKDLTPMLYSCLLTGFSYSSSACRRLSSFVFYFCMLNTLMTSSIRFSMPDLSFGLKLFCTRVRLMSELLLKHKNALGFIPVKLLNNYWSLLKKSLSISILWRFINLSRSCLASSIV